MADERGRDRGDRRGGRATGPRTGADRRDARAREARAHTEEMEARFGGEIAAAVAGTKVYDGVPKRPVKPVPEPASEPEPADGAPADPAAAAPAGPEAAPAEAAAPELPAVTVVDQDSVAAVVERGRGRAQFCDLALLDFASFRYPGGGYDRGAWAQEEALCAESYLFNALSAQKAWYAENRRRNVNCELYRDRGLIVPAVRFTRGKLHAYADVLVVAAPNARRAREDYRLTDGQLDAAMRDRVRFALALADETGREKLVLGAFGCGVFGWDAERVAEVFRAELAAGGHVAREVVFAVPSSRHDENLAKFQHVLGSFPAAPAEPYAAAARRAAEARADAAARDADDADDDWRKYL